MSETTIDKLLNGRFAVEQPAKGYRISVDTLLLAAAVPLREGQKALDMGCGVGGVMLALAARIPGAMITGVEIQPYMASLCASNIQRNGWDNWLNVTLGNVQALPEDWANSFDHVVMNPPYHDTGRHITSANPSKRIANNDEDGDLEIWLRQAACVLKDGGVMSMINRSDRTDEIAELCAPLFGKVQIKPIWSKADGTCKRIIVRAHKGGAHKVVNETPFILYGSNGRYSEAGDQLLREAQEMVF